MAVNKENTDWQSANTNGVNKAILAFASFGGVGYIKGGGSIAAAIICVAWYFFNPAFNTQIIYILIVVAAGVWSADIAGKIWNKKDDSRIVIDEVAGMLISVAGITRSWGFYLSGFIIFRFFDIVKPLGIRKTEQLGGGWGVMADDVLAGIYTLLVLQIIELVKI